MYIMRVEIKLNLNVIMILGKHITGNIVLFFEEFSLLKKKLYKFKIKFRIVHLYLL